ncbi:lipopolysaccharide biosynthesis protein [Vibrio sp. WXL103]|uniref:lipopolysaccharide biosynthesis protein n=1 Tax=Vibrio sp. WXL103 TaxID=3450710 RepID=UPI003EC81493
MNIKFGEFGKNIAQLVGSSVLSKLISISIIPLLTRIYQPEEFGIYTTAMSIMTVCGGLISLRICDAIPIASNEMQAKGVAELSILSSIILAPIMFFAVAPFYTSTNNSFDSLVISLVIIGSLLIAVYETLSFYSVRHSEYKVISVTQLLQSLFGGGIKAMFGVIGSGSVGLILGAALQQGLGVVYMLRKYSLFNLRSSRWTKYRLSYHLIMFRRYKEYPQFRLPSRIILALTSALPIIYFGRVYGNEEVGYLGLAMSMISIPATMIVANVRKVYYGEVSQLEKKHPEKIMAITLFVVLKMSMLAILFSVGLFLFAENAFSIVFGKGWSEAGYYSKALSLQVAMSFIAGPIVDLFNVLGKVRYYFYFNLLKLFFLLVALFLSYVYLLPPIETLLLISLSVAAYYLVQTVSVFTLVGRLRVDGTKAFR